jgi:hypothetical protein
LDRERVQRIKNAVGSKTALSSIDVAFLAEETRWPISRVSELLRALNIQAEV